MKKKLKSAQSTSHVQEQCGVWLSAKGRSKLQEGSNNQRVLPCIATPRQSRVVLGELVIPQPRPRIGGKQSTLSMFFKPVPISKSSPIGKCNATVLPSNLQFGECYRCPVFPCIKETNISCAWSQDNKNSPTQGGEMPKINKESAPTGPLLKSRCINHESLVSNDSEVSCDSRENNSVDRRVNILDCGDSEIDGFTGCTLDADSLETYEEDILTKESNSDELSLGKFSYVFQKPDHAYRTRTNGSRKRSHSPNATADKSLLVEDAPAKRCRNDSYEDGEDVSETMYFGSERNKGDHTETKENSLGDNVNTNDMQNVSFLGSKHESEMVNSGTSASVMSEAKGENENGFIYQNQSPLDAPVDNFSQSNASSEDSFSEDDSLTPAILRNSIYKELDLTSQLPLTNPQSPNANETLKRNSFNLDDIPETLAFDSLSEWSVSENDSTEVPQ